MQPKLTIQERLKDLRVGRGLTLEQLSAETGVSKSALGKYEADDFKDISPFSMVELAKFYGVSTDYLLGLTEQKNHPNTELDALHLGLVAFGLYLPYPYLNPPFLFITIYRHCYFNLYIHLKSNYFQHFLNFITTRI